MKKRLNKLPKQAVSFFLLYFILMGSLIYFAMTNQHEKNSNPRPTSMQAGISNTFSKEMALYEEKKKQKDLEQVGNWKPSKSFLIISISVASIVDIVIILLWARHENKKRERFNMSKLKKWTDHKWFWNIVAMGIVQPKNNRIVINWKNLILFFISIYLIKVLLFRYLDNKIGG